MRLTRHPLSTEATERRASHLPVDGAVVRRLQRSFAALMSRPDTLAATLRLRLAPWAGIIDPGDLPAIVQAVVAALEEPPLTRAILHEAGRGVWGRVVVAAGARFSVALAAALSDAAGEAWTDADRRDWERAASLMVEIMREGAALAARCSRSEG